MDQDVDPCQNIKDRYNRSGKYHVDTRDYVPQENETSGESKQNQTIPDKEGLGYILANHTPATADKQCGLGIVCDDLNTLKADIDNFMG